MWKGVTPVVPEHGTTSPRSCQCPHRLEKLRAARKRGDRTCHVLRGVEKDSGWTHGRSGLGKDYWTLPERMATYSSPDFILKLKSSLVMPSPSCSHTCSHHPPAPHPPSPSPKLTPQTHREQDGVAVLAAPQSPWAPLHPHAVVPVLSLAGPRFPACRHIGFRLVALNHSGACPGLPHQTAFLKGKHHFFSV